MRLLMQAPQKNLQGANAKSRVFLRFRMAKLGLHVETEHFCLLAKRDPKRPAYGEPPARPKWGPPPVVQPSLPVGGDPISIARTKLSEAEAQLTASLGGGRAGVQDALAFVQQAQSKLTSGAAAGGDEQLLAVGAQPMLPPPNAPSPGAVQQQLELLAPSRIATDDVLGLSLDEAIDGVQELIASYAPTGDALHTGATAPSFQSLGAGDGAETGALAVPGARHTAGEMVDQARQLQKRISPESSSFRSLSGAAAAAPAAAAAAAEEAAGQSEGSPSKRARLEQGERATLRLQGIFRDGLDHHAMHEANGAKRLAAIVRSLTRLIKSKTPQHQVRLELGRIGEELNDLGQWLDFVGQ